MSAIQTNFRSSQKMSDKKFCGVCHKKGLPESVYTSHFTKSVPGNKGVVTCPTILNASCSFCGGKGHWADEKFCSAMRNQNRSADRRRAPGPSAPSAPVVSRAPANQNVFACLADDDCLAVAPAVARGPAPVPAVVPAVAISTPTPGVSWASMASRPAVLVKKDEPMNTSFVPLVHGGGGGKTVYYDNSKPSSEPLMSASEREAFRILQERKAEFADRPPRMSWADMNDSDDDEEDEYDEDHDVLDAWD
jgi:hypothetical protein